MADRKLIDKAKGILMTRKGLSEAAAYQLIRTARLEAPTLIIIGDVVRLQVKQGQALAA